MNKTQTTLMDDLRTLNAITRLSELIGESLPDNPHLFLKQVKAAMAIAGLSNLENLWPQMALWILDDPQLGLLQFCPGDQGVLAVTDNLRTHLSDTYVSDERWRLAAQGASISSFRHRHSHLKTNSEFSWCAGLAGSCIALSMMAFTFDDVALDGKLTSLIEYAVIQHSQPFNKVALAIRQRTKLFELMLGKELSG